MAVVRETVPGAEGFEETGSAWTDKLRRRRGEGYVGDEANVLTALRTAPQLRGIVRYNTFRNVVEFSRSPMWRTIAEGDVWTASDDIDLQQWLQEIGIDVRQRGVVSDCVERVARDTPLHPVMEYLDTLEWDGTARLSVWLKTYCSATGNDQYLSAVGSAFLISAVARIMRPGVKVDTTLVLEGAQGSGKSSAARILAGPWGADGLPNLHDKDSVLYLQGVWIVELPELAAVRRTADLEQTKAFLSRTSDRVRPPYGRRTIDLPRQCVFIATTNERQYLRDPTGNRRFWPVHCGAIDLNGLKRDRDHLWAEAVARYVKGDAWHLTAAEDALARAEQAGRVFVTELEQQVTTYLDGLVDRGVTETTPREILITAVNLDPDSERYAELAGRLGPQVAAILNRNRWERVGEVGRSPNRRVIYRHEPETHRGSQGNV